ncbi:hypothetical protein TNIN_352631 [Trichonephila inaurata madagascariensis]|uniref:Uncharacterized protein n=1 Tax=Trichonephila inaurata madagascariensis TaxID=2747483 RepID=A0A8X6XIS1_9ARAC|nr:hypothetical protein TNIN_352631 [Trichonephila inaurata madagascariensis]
MVRRRSNSLDITRTCAKSLKSRLSNWRPWKVVILEDVCSKASNSGLEESSCDGLSFYIRNGNCFNPSGTLFGLTDNNWYLSTILRR